MLTESNLSSRGSGARMSATTALASGFAVHEGQARGCGDAGRVEVVARADADVEVVAPHVGAEERQEVGGGRTAPGVRVDEVEDSEVVDGEAPRGVEFLGLFVEGSGDGGGSQARSA